MAAGESLGPERAGRKRPLAPARLRVHPSRRPGPAEKGRCPAFVRPGAAAGPGSSVRALPPRPRDRQADRRPANCQAVARARQRRAPLPFLPPGFTPALCPCPVLQLPDSQVGRGPVSALPAVLTSNTRPLWKKRPPGVPFPALGCICSNSSGPSSRNDVRSGPDPSFSDSEPPAIREGSGWMALSLLSLLK